MCIEWGDVRAELSIAVATSHIWLFKYSLELLSQFVSHTFHISSAELAAWATIGSNAECFIGQNFLMLDY